MGKNNLTHDGNKEMLYADLFCLPESTAGIKNQLIFLAALNIFLSITALLGNSLILAVLRKESSLHPPSKIMFQNLAIADFCAGIIAEPVIAICWLSVVNKRWDICRFALIATHITGYILGSTSLFTLTTISVDRLLALLLGLKYRQVVTLKRTGLTIAISWAVSIVSTTFYFWNYVITSWISSVAISLCLCTSFFSYSKIFLTLRHHRVRAQDHVNQQQQSQAIPMNIVRYKKAVFVTLWAQITLLVCYLPHGIVEAFTQRGLSSTIFLARSFTATLVYLKSTLNPIVYCWKMTEVRRAVIELIRDLFC